jgi:hypothetical protein
MMAMIADAVAARILLLWDMAYGCFKRISRAVLVVASASWLKKLLMMMMTKSSSIILHTMVPVAFEMV